jgi:hypothetical protein
LFSPFLLLYSKYVLYPIRVARSVTYKYETKIPKREKQNRLIGESEKTFSKIFLLSHMDKKKILTFSNYSSLFFLLRNFRLVLVRYQWSLRYITVITVPNSNSVLAGEFVRTTILSSWSSSLINIQYSNDSELGHYTALVNKLLVLVKNMKQADKMADTDTIETTSK